MLTRWNLPQIESRIYKDESSFSLLYKVNLMREEKKTLIHQERKIEQIPQQHLWNTN